MKCLAQTRKKWQHNRLAGRLGGIVALIFLLTGVAGQAQTLQNQFTNRQTFTATSRDITVDNSAATVEPNEPKHGGKVGGHSLWLTWQAPSDGVVTFYTLGSAIDTLLSSYYFQTTNDTTLAQLKELAESDDTNQGLNPGSVKSSSISFGVQAGKKYEIAVDGYKGATGSIRLRWDYEVAPSTPPIVLTTPNSSALKLGDPVTLSVDLTGEPNVNLQWRFNGESFGQTGDTLFIPSLTTNDLGTYTLRVEVEVGNNRVRFETTPFELQINSEGETNVLARDKLLDSPDSGLLGDDGGSSLTVSKLGGLKTLALVNGGSAAQSLGVVRGYNGSQIFNTFYASADPGEPAHCSVVGGSSYWLIYQPPTNGTLTLDTVGSSYDTVLETYTYNGGLTGYQDLISLACDNNAFGTNGPSRVQVPVIKSRQYVISVGGVNAAYGVAWLNYSLNTNSQPQAPTLMSTPQPQTVAVGGTVVFTAPVTGSVPLSFTWRKDNEVMVGQTGSALVLSPVTNSHSGNYSFTVTNDLGSVSGTFALKVVVPPVCGLKRIPTGMQLSYPTLEGQVYTIEESTNLLTGWTAWPGAFVGNGLTNFFNVWNSGTKFYRVRVE